MQSRRLYRESLRALLPDTPALEKGLASVFSGNGSEGAAVKLLDRQPFLYASTFPSEILTCRLEDGSERRLLCKYGSRQRHDKEGHGGGPAYEATVYRQVLQPLRTSAPAFYGAHNNGKTGETWLFIEYLEGATRLDEAPSPELALGLAARWSGEFQAASQRLEEGALSVLNVYNRDYYVRWLRRTLQFIPEPTGPLAWLAALCSSFEDALDELLAPPQTTIHGEYTVHNNLILGDRVCPVDWESAAIAAGEIDLASLTEGWSAEVVRNCEWEYRKTRWPSGSPAGFSRRLDLARVYWTMRWLGHKVEWFETAKGRVRLGRLRAAAERLELL